MTNVRTRVPARATTSSGAVYEFEQRPEGLYLRRANTTAELGMRQDEAWLRVLTFLVPPQLDKPLAVVLEPLGEGDVTVRNTTRVTDIVWAA